MKLIRLFCLVLVSMFITVGCEEKESAPKSVRITPVRTDVVLGRTVLHSAPNWDIAKRLIAQGADVNAKDNFGMTPLHTAIRAGCKDVVDVLVASGADINAKTNSGQTPLFWAVAQSRKGMAERLIVNGAYINTKDKYGHSPALGGYGGQHGCDRAAYCQGRRHQCKRKQRQDAFVLGQRKRPYRNRRTPPRARGKRMIPA